MKITTISLALLGLPAALAADLRARVAPPPTDSHSSGASTLTPTSSISGSLTIANSYSHPSTASTKSAPTSTGPLASSANAVTAAVGGSVTELAVFTAGGGIYTVTSASGQEAVDGKPLSLGGPAAFIAGEYVSQASSGIVADGQTIQFVTYSASSSMAVNPMTMSTAAASGSASGSASAAASTSGSAGAAAPRQTGAAANVVGVLGMVVGAMML